ncbi:MAG: VPLPA-CTERM sorting domain-containing protein [Pseudomonadota bacterium]
MKKILIALGFTLAAMSAQSATLTAGDLSLEYNATAVDFTDASVDAPTAGNDVTFDTQGYNGQLSASADTVFRVTYLGKEAGNQNFYLQSGAFYFDTNTAVVGETYDFVISAGVIDFGFTGSGGLTAENKVGGSNINNIYYLLDSSSSGSFNIGFNDGGSLDLDADDLVVRVSSVPVPAALPLLASALGAFGIARRRNKAKAA